MIFTNFSRSLAIVFTPSLFPVTEEATNIKKVEVTNADLANKLEIVQALIENSNAVSFYKIITVNWTMHIGIGRYDSH